VNYADFINLVAQRDLRPERPDAEDAPHLLDAIWDLAEKCWVRDPKYRPTAIGVCDIVSCILDTAALPQPTSNLSPSHTIVQLNPHPPLTPPPNLAMRGHTDFVYCATFSADGKYIASGSSDRTIRVWDAQTGNTTLGPLKHTNSVYCVTFSPNGRRLASGSHPGGAILVWDAATGQVAVGPFKGHTFFIMSVIFSPDGRRIASGSADNTIRVWDAQPLGTKQSGFIISIGKHCIRTYSLPSMHSTSQSL
jgi:WD40 repeat protein